MADTKRGTQNNATSNDRNSEFTLYRHRWVILAVFSFVSMTNEVIWISLSSIASIVKVYYNVSYTAVNWLSMIYMLFYVFVVVAVYTLNRYGLKTTIVTGAALNACGSWLRFAGVGRNGFANVFVGSALAALGQCFLLFIPPRLAAAWFGDHERSTASAVGMLITLSGVAVGFLTAGTIVPSSKDLDGAVRKGMFNLLVSQAAFSSILLFTALFVVEDHPPTPPSRSQALLWKLSDKDLMAKLLQDSPEDSTEDLVSQSDSEATRNKTRTATDSNLETENADEKSSLINANNQPKVPNLLKTLEILGKDMSFHLITQAYGLYFGQGMAFNTILNEMVTPKHPGKERLIGFMGFTSILCGLVGIYLGGIWLDKTHKYKIFSGAIFIACAISMLSFTVILTYHDSFAFLFVSCGIFGFFSFPFISAGLEYAAEITYPISEGTTSGILCLVGSMYGIGLVYLVEDIIRKYGSDIGGYVMAGSYGVALVMVILINAPLKRTNVEEI